MEERINQPDGGRTMVRTDRGYFILLVGVLGAFGILDTAILNPTVAAFASSLGADDFLASFIAGLYSLVAIPASILMGLAIDSIGRKRALVAGLGLTALWIYGYSLATTPLHLLLFRITHSVSGSLVFPATIAMVADAAKREMGRGIGVYWMVIGIALAVGSFVSASLVPSLGFRSLYLLVAAMSLVGMAVALALPETAAERLPPGRSVGVLRASFRWLSVSYVSIFSLYFAFGAIVGSLSLAFILTGLTPEAAARNVGLYIGLATLVSLPLFYVVGRLMRRLGATAVLLTGISFTALSQLLLALSLGPSLLYVSSALLGVAIAAVYVASTTLAVLPRARGASVGLHQTTNIAGVAVGAPVSGLLLQTFGLAAPFAAAVAVQLAALLVIVAGRGVTRTAETQALEA